MSRNYWFEKVTKLHEVVKRAFKKLFFKLRLRIGTLENEKLRKALAMAEF